MGTEGSDACSHPPVPTPFVAADLGDGGTGAGDRKPAQ